MFIWEQSAEKEKHGAAEERPRLADRGSLSERQRGVLWSADASAAGGRGSPKAGRWLGLVVEGCSSFLRALISSVT